jgi:multiple sugar transport system permease protein
MRRHELGAYAFTAFAALVALLVLMPLLWMLAVSLMQPGAAAQFPPPLWPEHPTLDNYRTLFQDYGIGRYAFNSLLVSVLATRRWSPRWWCPARSACCRCSSN